MISEELRTATDEKIKAAIDLADPMVLRGTLYHATSDDELKAVKTSVVPGLFNDMTVIDDQETLVSIRAKAFNLLTGYRDGTLAPPAQVSDERLHTAMNLVIGGQVPGNEFELYREELAIEPERRSLQWKRKPDPQKLAAFRVLVIGAGLGGIGAGVQLKKAGFNFSIVEKNPDVGGTWYQNRYPGARVDLPSRIYSHSFAINYHFDYPFSPQKENEKYIHWCADSYGLRKHIRFNTEAEELRWDEKSNVWVARIRQPDGSHTTETANAVISAVGFLDRPQLPDFEGLDEYQGIKMHTAAFKMSPDFAEKSVGVIGTGATGMQLVPDLQPKVGHLTIFQRSPGWVFPVPGYRSPYPDGLNWLNRHMPYYAHWTRFAQAWAIGDHCLYDALFVDPDWKDPNTTNAENLKVRERCMAHLKAKLANRPDLIEKTVPNYPPLAKRQIIDNGWFDAIVQNNVELIHNDPIKRFTKTGVTTQSGREIPLDVTVFATGFKANDYFWPMKIVGLKGTSLSSLWENGGARAYWGITLAHMPNFFCVYGPNTNPVNTGPVPLGEMQVRYILKCLEAIVTNGWDYIDVRTDIFDAHNAELDRRHATSIQHDKRQKSYYINEFGRSAVNSPWLTFEYWSAVREPNFNDYRVVGHAESADARSAGARG